MHNLTFLIIFLLLSLTLLGVGIYYAIAAGKLETKSKKKQNYITIASVLISLSTLSTILILYFMSLVSSRPGQARGMSGIEDGWFNVSGPTQRPAGLWTSSPSYLADEDSWV